MLSSFAPHGRPRLARLRPPRPPRRGISAGSLAVVAIVLLIGVGGLLRAEAIGGDRRVSSDEHGNAINTNAILEHGHYRTFRWAPGTPFVFAVATRLRGHRTMAIVKHSHGPAQYAQLLLEIATLVLIALVAWVSAGPWAALLAIACAALYIPLILLTRTYLTEPLGGLMILAAFAGAIWARRRGSLALAGAGALAGLGCLAREDLFPAVLVIALALAWERRRGSRRRAARRGVVYLVSAIVVIAPWVIYASGREGRFVPITNGGPDAFFVGSYLPGHGEQYRVVRDFKGGVCRRYPGECRHYASRGTAAMFRLIAARYPHLAPAAAITRADLENVRRYALGHPFAYAGMLANKLWRMWSEPWSGGNGAKHPDTSRLQHRILAALAWLGLLAGALLLRRWSFITVTAGLAAITFLNILVNAQGRDNLRLMPLLFTFGMSGLWLTGRELASRRVAGDRRPKTAAT